MKIATLKIGTRVILNEKLKVNKKVIFHLGEQISFLLKKGYFFYIVSSGARGFGKKIVKEKNQNYDYRVASAMGQVDLISLYKDIFSSFNLKVAQLLLQKDMFVSYEKCESLKNLLRKFLQQKNILPIINENDPLVFDEKSFGENDSLGTAVALITNSSKLVFLSNVDGIYQSFDSSKIIREIKNVNKEIERQFCFQRFSPISRGGMVSKLRSAKLATLGGIEVFIINGKKKNSLRDLFLGKEIGTKILPSKKSLSERQKRMLVASLSQGKIFVDEGAKQALFSRKSLLAVGIKKVVGFFRKKDFINICDIWGEIFAIGKVNYSSKELCVLNSFLNKEKIKEYFPKEVVHADNLVLF